MHVNHKRGETRTFVWRREHMGCTHRTVSKGKSRSHRTYKRICWEHYRAQVRTLLKRLRDDPDYEQDFPEYRERVRWLAN